MTKRFSVSGKLKRNGKIIKVILSFRNLPEQNQNGERREGRAARRERSIPDSHQDPSSSRTSRKESVLLVESVECSSRYSKRGRFCVTFSRKRSMRHFGPSIGQTTGGKFFFSFLSLLTSSSSSSFLSFFFGISRSFASSRKCARVELEARVSWRARIGIYLLPVRYVVRLVNSVSILDRVPKNFPRGPSNPQ